MKRLLIPLILLIPALAAAQPVSPFPPGVTPPIFGLPASAVNGSGVLSTTCLSWPLGTTVCEDAAQRLTQRNTTSAERFDVANTWASTISNELFSVDWQTQANVAIAGTRTAATGTGRQALFGSQASNASAAMYGVVTNSTSPYVRLGPTTTALGSVTIAATGNYVTVFDLATDGTTSGTRAIFAITPTYNQSSGTAANTDLLINRTQTAVGSGAQKFLQAGTAATPDMFSLDNTGKATTYTSVATAGQGLAVVRAQATTGTVTNSGTASIATWTPGAADVEVEVGCRVNITVSTTHSFSCDVTYTDVANVARTRVLPMYPINGNQLTNSLMTNTVGTGDYGSMTIRIGVKASTAITVRTSSGGTFTTVTYTASGTIKQVG